MSVDMHEPADEDLRQWAECVRATIRAGVAGLSITDRAGNNQRWSTVVEG